MPTTISVKSTGQHFETDQRYGNVRALFGMVLTNEQIAAGDALGLDWLCVDCDRSICDDRASEHGIGRCI